MAQFEATTAAEAEAEADSGSGSGPGRVIVSLAGEADLSVRDELTRILLEAVATAPIVVVDLGALTFLDSSGLHSLIVAYRAARGDDRQLYIRNASGMVAEVLRLTGVADLLDAPADAPAPPTGNPPAGG